MHRKAHNRFRNKAAVVALATVVSAVTMPADPAAADPKRADLSVTVTADPTDVSVEGQWATLAVDVRNVGTGTASNVAVTLSRPAGVGVGGGENPSPPGWNCTFGEPDWTCVSGSLAPGVAEQLTLQIYIPAGTTAETVVVGAVATTTSRESLLTNNSGTVTFRHVAPDLAVNMVAKPTEVIPGGEVTYWIDVRNLGGPARAVMIQLPVPAGMRGVTRQGPYGWDCSYGTDTTTGVSSYDCTYQGGLASGATSEPLTITTQVDQLAPGDTPAATVTVETVPGVEEVTTNNTASAAVTVVEPGFISGLVWSDYDRDGIRDAGEPGEGQTVKWVTVFPRSAADGDPVDYPVSVNADGTWRLALKPGQYVVQAGVDAYYSRFFSPPDVGDDATDSDVVPVDDPGNYYRYAESAVIAVTAGGESVVDIGIIDS